MAKYDVDFENTEDICEDDNVNKWKEIEALLYVFLKMRALTLKHGCKEVNNG